jgi:hypothetical protein
VTDKPQKIRELSPEELEAQMGEALPAREEMQLVDVDLNLAAPVNAAVAANVLSSDSTAIALADQDANIDQWITEQH